MKNKKVSIFCLTYNHVQYIECALQGFLRQKTDFEFNILIYDDASTDGTSEIVKKYEQMYPDKIKAYVSPENLYGKSVRDKVLNELYKKYLNGEYIAWCEGDDYWSDDCKLQVQVDYLEAHIECSMVTHAYELLDCRNSETKSIRLLNVDDYLTNEQIINKTNGCPATASLVMRREVFFFEDEYPKSDVMDVPIQLNAIRYGQIYYMDRCMAVYRFMHQGSWYDDMSKNFEKMVYHKLYFVVFLKKYNLYTNLQFEKYIVRLYRNYLYSISEEDIPINIFMDIYESLSPKFTEEVQALYVKCLEIYKWINCIKKFSDEEIERCISADNIIIFGNGKYAKIVENVLIKNKISVCGNLVTYKECEKINSNLWEIQDFPFEKKHTLIIVGIHQNNQEGLIKELNNNGFCDIWTPVWID